ncbi:hypothetical protein BKA70DRAFT_1265956 [Coprinopsis sp. MPI-PUGE-AT-0042]|nr:hypothetical protein BKA70DRAFT_1265956 [Coprinopsis sp. MPI-PUGE-AT-0042]
MTPLSRQVCVTIPTTAGLRAAVGYIFHDIMMEHRFFSFVLLLVWMFNPFLPFQILWYFVWTVPRSILLGLLSCLGFEHEGVRRGKAVFT